MMTLNHICRIVISFFFVVSNGASGTTITVVNGCGFTVWPAIYSSHVMVTTTGFELTEGSSHSFQAPKNWSGILWGRTGCTFNESGHGSCKIGDCGSDEMACNGKPPTPPVTIAGFDFELVREIGPYQILTLCFNEDYTVTFCPPHDEFSTIKVGNNLNINEQLVSISGNFTLGFFEDDHRWYLGIWYTGDAEARKVWVGNPNNPFLSSTLDIIALSIDQNTGNLIIIDYARTTLMKISDVQAGPNPNVTATLDDSGNFRVINEIDKRVLWQSFDHPTNVLLPGMKLGYNKTTGQNWTLTSSQTGDTFETGSFTLSWDPTDETSQRIMIRRYGQPYWSGFLEWETFKYGYLSYENGQTKYTLTYVYNNEEQYASYIAGITGYDHLNDPFPMWILTPKGQLTDYNNSTLLTPEFCYGYNTSKGCVSNRTLCRRDNDFFSHRNGEFAPQMARNITDSNSSIIISDCFSKCWNDCSCVGFDSSNTNGTGCVIWTGSNNLFVEERGDSKMKYVIRSQNTSENSPNIPSTSKNSPNNPTTRNKMIWALVVVPLFLGLGILWYMMKKQKQKQKEYKRSKRDEYFLELAASESFKDVHQLQSDGRYGDMLLFSFASIMAATHDFSVANKLGQGGFGPVYKGTLDDGREIAIKRLSRSSGQGLIEFKNELILIAKLQHTNLVRILDENRKAELDWPKRFNIIEGIAQGLLYLHKYSRMRVIHRDLKSNNILLDERMNPKISDFGMARIFGQNESQATTNRVVGTYGYMSPEYAMEGTFSIKSDIYSFGVLILEIVSGRRNSSFVHLDRTFNLLGYAWELWRQGNGMELEDPTLRSTCVEQQFLRTLHVALLCVQERALDRPTTSDMISMLLNDTISLPNPKTPAFFTHIAESNSTLDHIKPEDCSLNNTTMSAILEGASGRTITVVNDCDFTVWPAIYSSHVLGTTTGFELTEGSSHSFQTPEIWSGTLWARTGCRFNGSGHGSCEIGDCGSHEMECNGGSPTPPVTLAWFNFTEDGLTFYSVSIINGYNLQMTIEPTGPLNHSDDYYYYDHCLKTGCIYDLNKRCPEEVRLEGGRGCNTTCQSCCESDAYIYSACNRKPYSPWFDLACPRSYYIQLDSGEWISPNSDSCDYSNYTVRFCPPADAFSTIKVGKHLTYNEKLISISGNFKLGFFSPNDYGWYFGIWYTSDAEARKVWVANPNNPLMFKQEDIFPALSIDVNTGNLIITDYGGMMATMKITDVHAGPNSNVIATLEDDGNFRLINEIDKSVLRQSFDHPTNVLLPGMKLGYNKTTGQNWTLTSWLTDDSFDSGAFTLSWEAIDETSQRLVIRRRGQPYWTSGFIDAETFQYMSLLYGDYQAKYILNTTFSTEERYFSYTDVPYYENMTDPFPMWVLTPKGQITGYNLSEPWTPEFCYGYNSTNGCMDSSSPPCWRQDDYFSYHNREFVPQLTKNITDSNSSISISDCFVKCLNDCSCVGFNSSNSDGTGCVIWSGSNDYFIDVGDNIPVNLFSPNSSYAGNYPGNKKEKNMNRIWALVVVPLFLSLGLLWYMKKRKQKRKDYKRRKTDEYFLELVASESFKDVHQLESDGHYGDLLLFSFASIMAATYDFSSENKLGQGGFGPVYKGRLEDGREIAIKRLSRSSGQGLVEFKNELILIAKLQHTNLVRILGCCIHREEKMLVYEYMPNKSLDFFLFDENRKAELDWPKRFNIIEGIAQGLLYLHKYSRMRVIHRDLKSNNILLDDSMNPKISDFGMARMFNQNETEATTNRVVGTYGYMSPEYAMEGTFSVKSDIYSFGVLILEIISGRRNTSFVYLDRTINLLGYAWELWQQGNEMELEDPTLGSTSVEQQFLRTFHVALLCVQDNAMDRPTTSDMISMLLNDTIQLPTPKRPAFFTNRGESNSTLDHIKSKDCSVNNMTISVTEGASGTTTITVVNDCGFTVWPGIHTYSTPVLDITGFELTEGSSHSFQTPANWSGILWGRTGCTFNGSGHGSCKIGNCGSDEMECNGKPPTPPVTIAGFDFTEEDYNSYNVSLDVGYNLEMAIEPSNELDCQKAGCIYDVNKRCPKELRVKGGGGCYTPCQVYGTPEHCCNDTCKPTPYNQLFDLATPGYNYICEDANYTVRFCPPDDAFSTIKVGNHLRYNGQLFSLGGRFMLGFFGDDDGHHDRGYLGIWYTRDDEARKVWVANPNHPFLLSTLKYAVSLSIDKNTGNLIITNDSGTTLLKITDVHAGPNPNVTATLEDTGNFRLINEIDKRVLWQSFDHPTNVLLPEYKRRKTNEFLELVASESFKDVYQLETDGRYGDLLLFSFATIIAATDDFSFQNKLGEGGFGPVYKGKLDDGSEIAIKRLSKTSKQGLVEFKNELIFIARLQHTNLVRILGCCIHKEEKMLVYEYMPNKSLNFFLFDENRKAELDWPKRFNIIEGIAQGLLYLHKYSRMKIIHGDLKPSNILLDDSMNPKIADFGMASMFNQNETEATTNRVVGTYGYMPPECETMGTFSFKSDIYSFGVLILEIVSGKKSSSFDCLGEASDPLVYAWDLWQQGNAMELKDPTLGSTFVEQQFLKTFYIALLCVQESAIDRPTTSDMISMLHNDTIPLPAPKRPRDESNSTSEHINSKECSVNNMSVSVMEGR
ncbi:hypothetical protein SSX86_011962 [Deinandra increscens subsp. villosa]|uniref:non-specific serine/threonine protein kinase n=1 Tax=Deinandra increscens subsp. villosa TaxID=3103831 RepID=A0AAP0D4Y9_9ASTR